MDLEFGLTLKNRQETFKWGLICAVEILIVLVRLLPMLLSQKNWLLFLYLPLVRLDEPLFSIQIVLFVVPWFQQYLTQRRQGTLYPVQWWVRLVTVVLMVTAYVVWTLLITRLLTHFGYPIANDSAVVSSHLNYWLLVIVPSVLAEEVSRYSLLFGTAVFLKRWLKSRGLRILIAVLVSSIGFGLMHYMAYSGRLLEILLIQGVSGLFFWVIWWRTRSLTLSWISHALIDLIEIII